MNQITENQDDHPSKTVAWEFLNEETRDELLEWLNVVEPDDDDRARLAALVDAGQFHFYSCAECGDVVRYAYPDDWKHFQGVCQDEMGMGELCADCSGLYLRLKGYAED